MAFFDSFWSPWISLDSTANYSLHWPTYCSAFVAFVSAETSTAAKSTAKGRSYSELLLEQTVAWKSWDETWKLALGLVSISFQETLGG